MVTELSEDVKFSVPPKGITGSVPEGALTVNEELDKTLLGTFESPNVIVPEPVIGEPESTSIPSVPEIATEVTVPVLVVYPASLLNPLISILPFVNFLCTFDESITAKKSPSPFVVDVVNSDKSTATVILPEVVIGELDTSISAPAVIPTEVTVPSLLENGKSDTKPFLTLL